MKIVFASHSHMSDNLVVGSHHLAREFAGLGHEVLHISTPVTAAHLFRRESRERVSAWRKGVIRHTDDLREIVPIAVIPWQISNRFGVNVYMRSTPFLKGQIHKAGFGQPDLLLIDEPRMAGICKILRPRQIIYRATDLYAVMRSDPSVDMAEREAIRLSQAMIATALPVLEHLRTFNSDKPAFVIENGVDIAHFSAPQPVPELYRELPKPRLLYVGALDRRLDFEGINYLALHAPELHVVVAGPACAKIELPRTSLSNLHYVGPVPYKEVPALMQHAEIGLLPLNDDPSNRGRSPMKLYEYAAAGLPVVARKTAELARRGGRFIHLYEDMEGMLLMIRSVLAGGSDKSGVAASAMPHSWTRKALEVLKFAEEVKRANGGDSCEPHKTLDDPCPPRLATAPLPKITRH